MAPATGNKRRRESPLLGEVDNMRSGLGLLGAFLVCLVFLALGAAGGVSAQTVDDVNWINKCIADNKDEGPARPVIVAYCTCMNNQMSNSETKSITAWEKDHPKETAECSKKAGWK
jgi:hypothetical protein